MEGMLLVVILGYAIFGFLVCRKNSPADRGSGSSAARDSNEDEKLFPLYFASVDNLPDEFWAEGD